MALKRNNTIATTFNMSSMSDLVFLLLIFFLVTSTLISPNALKLLLPKSNSQIAAKPSTSVSITPQGTYFIETVPVTKENLQWMLQEKMKEVEDPTIALHADQKSTMEQVVVVMNIAKNNKWKLILATSPEE